MFKKIIVCFTAFVFITIFVAMVATIRWCFYKILGDAIPDTIFGQGTIIFTSLFIAVVICFLAILIGIVLYLNFINKE